MRKFYTVESIGISSDNDKIPKTDYNSTTFFTGYLKLYAIKKKQIKNKLRNIYGLSVNKKLRTLINSNQTNKIGKCYPYNFDCGSFIDKLYYVSRFLFDW